MVGKGHSTPRRPVKSNHQKGPPMDTQEPNAWSAVIGAGTAVAGALAGWFGKRRAESRSERDGQITERDRLLELVNTELVEPLRIEVKDLRERLEKAESRNTSLLAYVYRLLAVLRRNHLEHEIPEPPEGVEL